MIDIKLPIGLMFTILGGLLVTFGFVTSSDPAVYKKTAGLNINLWAGGCMLVFGLVMLLLFKWFSRTANRRPSELDRPQPKESYEHETVA